MQHPASTPASPANSPSHHNVSRTLLLQTTTPYLSPPTSGFSVPQYLGVTRKRLLVPTVRRPGDGCSPKPASRPVSKLMRSTSGSTTHHSSPDPGAAPRQVTWAGKEWIGVDCRFEVVEELELEGYQIYAVEKWYVAPWFHTTPEVNRFSRVVERTRPITVLTVYTGDPKHKVCPTKATFLAVLSHGSRKIAVTALSPASSLTHHEAQLEWEKAVQVLRRDDARPREVDSISSPRFTRLTITLQDRTRDTDGDVAGELPFRLHHCPNT